MRRVGRRPALFVDPVRGDAALGLVLHLGGTDLDFDALAERADHAGVQRAVAVRLGHRDVVLEALRQHLVAAMQQAERLVALRHVGDDDAEGHDVGELLERHVLLLHLAPDRIGRLLAARYLGVAESALLQGLEQLGLDLWDDLVALFQQVTQPRLDGSASIGIELGKSELLELALDPLHADPRGKRRVEIHGLERDAPTPRRVLDMVQGPHVVQAVGQLHQEHADVR